MNAKAILFVFLVALLVSACVWNAPHMLFAWNAKLREANLPLRNRA
jgi:hypothetical protein